VSFNVYSRVNTQLSATRTSSKRALTSGIKHVQQLHQVCDFCNSGSWSLASVLVLNFFYYYIKNSMIPNWKISLISKKKSRLKKQPRYQFFDCNDDDIRSGPRVKRIGCMTTPSKDRF